ncbi:MAG: hypothetical protein HDR29_00145 [Lachnospiraceae bacterium]|nr:hypothetical protein [Lachnospiraceae bacterium]
MSSTNKLTYYDFIMGDSEESMKAIFHKKWIAFLDELEVPYGKAIQLRIGNHLRPLLVYWGNAMGAESVDTICVDAVTAIALCVEIMHKTSIIIDDLIDADEKRHNKTAFHKQYSQEETIIFAVYFLGKAFQKMNELSTLYPALNSLHMGLFSQTLCSMANGCLQELTLTSESRYDIKKISNIISMETSTLIKNSALLGFIISKSPTNAQIKLLNDIGDKVGYLFQAMNDLEPFSSFENISFHKGSLNTDFERSRKNLIVTYIYGMCSAKEKQRLLESNNSPEAIPYMIQLYKKYNIFNVVRDDLKDVESQVDSLLSQLANQQINKQCLDEFHIFFTEIMKIAKDKLFTNTTIEID